MDVRLGQKMPPFIEHEHSFGEHGHQQHFKLWPLASDLIGDIYAGYFRHLEVCQQQIYFVLIIFRLQACFGAATGAENLVVAVEQQSRQGIQIVWIVVNDKNRLLIAPGCGFFFHSGDTSPVYCTS
jgi:hypothetical protein